MPIVECDIEVHRGCADCKCCPKNSPDIEYVYTIINDIETRESANSVKFSPILHEARCAERMKAWEKILYWSLDGKSVS